MIATRLSLGAISKSSSSDLPPSVASKPLKPVTFPSGGRAADEPAGNGIVPGYEDDRDRRCSRWRATTAGAPACQDDVGSQADQLLRERSYPIGVSARRTEVHPHVAASDPTQARERLHERGAGSGVVFIERKEHADVPDAVALLRTRRKRPRSTAPPSSVMKSRRPSSNMARPSFCRLASNGRSLRWNVHPQKHEQKDEDRIDNDPHDIRGPTTLPLLYSPLAHDGSRSLGPENVKPARSA